MTQLLLFLCVPKENRTLVVWQTGRQPDRLACVCSIVSRGVTNSTLYRGGGSPTPFSIVGHVLQRLIRGGRRAHLQWSLHCFLFICWDVTPTVSLHCFLFICWDIPPTVISALLLVYLLGHHTHSVSALLLVYLLGRCTHSDLCTASCLFVGTSHPQCLCTASCLFVGTSHPVSVHCFLFAGLATFSDTTDLKFNLNTYNNKYDVLNALAFRMQRGRTNTQEALRIARDDMFSSRNGDRWVREWMREWMNEERKEGRMEGAHQHIGGALNSPRRHVQLPQLRQVSEWGN